MQPIEYLYALASMLLKQVENPFLIQLQDGEKQLSAVTVMRDARALIDEIDHLLARHQVAINHGETDVADALAAELVANVHSTIDVQMVMSDPALEGALEDRVQRDRNRHASLTTIARLRAADMVLDVLPTGVLLIKSPWGNAAGNITSTDDRSIHYVPGAGDEGKTVQDLIKAVIH